MPEQNKSSLSIAQRILKYLAGMPSWLYRVVVLAVSCGLYAPFFTHPPRSDFWPAFYYFHRIDQLAGGHKWQYLLTHDPLINVTFRPFSFLFQYFEHLVFGSNLMAYNIFSFAMFATGLWLWSHLVARFCRNRYLIFAGMLFLGCMFSHFDLVCWSFHTHILLCFNFFMLGFILFCRYIENHRWYMVPCVVVCFLMGMSMYETFIAWPALLFVLVWAYAPQGGNTKGLYKAALIVCIFVYGTYFPLFFIDRLAKSSYMEQLTLSTGFSPYAVVLNFCAVFFNLAYNNLLVNLIPYLAFPLDVQVNLNMGGLVLDIAHNIESIMLFVGGVVMIGVVAGLLWAARHRSTRGIWFFTLLLVTKVFILFFFKSMVNPYPYNLTQFRFHYIANVMFLSVIIIVLQRFLMTFQKLKFIILPVALCVLLMNFHTVRLGIGVLDSQMAPLRRLLVNIRYAIDRNTIDPLHRLYLDDDIAAGLPPLCWNSEMGRRCMQGTYQWFYSRRQIRCFAPLAQAEFEIDRDDLSVAKITGKQGNGKN